MRVTVNKPMQIAAVLLLVSLLVSAQAHAVTWVQDRIVDPISGEACEVSSMQGPDSETYLWPEKYDQVFLPMTATQGIRYCPGSGFVDFAGDPELNENEKSRIAAFLAKAPRLPLFSIKTSEKLQRAEAIYSLRELPESRRALVHRALAYDFEVLANDPERAKLHRKAALRIMLDQLLDEALPQSARLEYLFVTANYLREFGDAPRSDRLLTQLETLISKSAGEQSAVYARYLGSLIPTARTIVPGGRLAP